MIAYIKGKIERKEEDFVVIETADIGYKVFCSMNTLEKFSGGEEVKLLTHLYLKEGIMDLYGFLTSKERELFKTLLGISGIGPKAALSITSIGSEEQLKKAIEIQDQKFFEGVKGLGKKKIQKIILELTGKFKEIVKAKLIDEPKDEAITALISLGFSSSAAKEALSQVPKEIQDTRERIQQALKISGKPI